jgi:hypothetical protein
MYISANDLVNGRDWTLHCGGLHNGFIDNLHLAMTHERSSTVMLSDLSQVR